MDGVCNVKYTNVFYMQWRSWLRQSCTTRKVAGSIPDGVTGIFHWLNPSGRTMTLGLTQPLTEMSKGKRKAIPITGLDRPWWFQEVEGLRLQDNRHLKVVRLSAIRTGRLYPPGNIPGTHFYWRLSQPQGHSAAGRIMSMKNSNVTIGNRTRDLPDCSAVPQTTSLPRAPNRNEYQEYFLGGKGSCCVGLTT